jgi:hypothetical protein
LLVDLGASASDGRVEWICRGEPGLFARGLAAPAESSLSGPSCTRAPLASNIVPLLFVAGSTAAALARLRNEGLDRFRPPDGRLQFSTHDASGVMHVDKVVLS